MTFHFFKSPDFSKTTEVQRDPDAQKASRWQRNIDSRRLGNLGSIREVHRMMTDNYKHQRSNRSWKSFFGYFLVCRM